MNPYDALAPLSSDTRFRAAPKGALYGACNHSLASILVSYRRPIWTYVIEYNAVYFFFRLTIYLWLAVGAIAGIRGAGATKVATLNCVEDPILAKF